MGRVKPFDGNFQMTEFEIIRDYGEALDKNEQIKILADLNVCKKEDIIAVLKKNGIPVPDKVGRKLYSRTTETNEKRDYEKKATNRKGRGVTWNKENLARLGEFVREGLSLQEMAERFGTGSSAISKQICKYGMRGGNGSVGHSDVDDTYIKELERLLKEKESEIKNLTENLVASEELCKDLTETLEKEKGKCEFCKPSKDVAELLLRVRNIKALASLCSACTGRPDIFNDLKFVFANICELSESIIEDLGAL